MMQRQAARATIQIARTASRPSANPVRQVPAGFSGWPVQDPVAGPSRYFASSASSLKKAKTLPAKPAKGKVRAQDDPSETDVDVEGALQKTRGRMEKAVNWAKAVIYDGVERGRGRVSPAILDTVRVQIPGHDSAQTLNSIASITVKQNTLFIELWDADGMKHVESALHSANLPGLSPQKVDQTTLKIPVSRPTHEQRGQIMRNLKSTIEGALNQVRTARADGFKLVGGKNVQGSDEVEKLASDFGGELDELATQVKKEFEK